MKGWLTADRTDLPTFEAQVKRLCELYQQAPTLLAQGVHVVSTDEKTGMQALERARPTLPLKPGLVERREFEYVRHGTACLFGNLEVATGRLLAPVVGPTRKEADFVANVERVVALAPSAGWVFVADNLDTHHTESLVRFVARALDDEQDLGQKYKDGILASKATRRAYLTDPEHRIRFVYTPKHCSWLNQVEIFFSVLARRVLRRGSFVSIDDLTQRVESFIKLYNERWAKPYKWTFTGRPLHS